MLKITEKFGFTSAPNVTNNISVEQLIPLEMQSHQFTYSNKNDITPKNYDINSFFKCSEQMLGGIDPLECWQTPLPIS